MKKIMMSMYVFALITIFSFNLCYAAPYDGAMPGNAINPLSHYAYSENNIWYSYDDLKSGFHISYDFQSIDTGYDINGNGDSWALDVYQWLAGQFTLSKSSTINSIQGYMWGQDDGQIRLAIYNSDNVDNIPVGAPIFNQIFSTSDADGWYGMSDMNLSLDAGTYWASFEVVPIPGAFLLFGSGLIGLLGIHRFKRNN